MKRMERMWIAAASLVLTLVHTVALAASNSPAANRAAIAPVGPIEVTYVLHFAPEPKGDVAKQAQELLKSKFPALEHVTESKAPGNKPVVYLEVLNMKSEGFQPPSMELLKYYGRGVTAEQGEAMQKSTLAAAVTFTYRVEDAFVAVDQATALMKELAARTNAVVWDVETRELFSPEVLGEERPAAERGMPDVRRHITIHAYKTDEYVRAVTLGMKKFGLPDIVLNEFSWAQQRPMGNTINLFAQSLVEGATPKMGTYDFDVSKLKHAEVRGAYENNLMEGARPIALLTLTDAAADEGDPDNRLLELRFDRYAGKTVHEKHEKFAATFYGSVDTVSHIKHNDAIRAASARARKQLPALRKAFNAGLEPGERILLKAPFERADGGNEWMWVEVSTWKGGDIRGLLANEPEGIPDLHAGATVEIDEEDVFDYLRYRADGTEEGNETGKEIAKQRRE